MSATATKKKKHIHTAPVPVTGKKTVRRLAFQADVAATRDTLDSIDGGVEKAFGSDQRHQRLVEETVHGFGERFGLGHSAR